MGIRSAQNCGVKTCLKTTSICLGVFSLGMLKAIVGASLLQLQKQTDASTESISTIFIAMSIGFLVGNVGIALIFRWVPFRIEYAFISAYLVLSVTLVVIPWCTEVLVLIGVFVVYGVSFGFCGGGACIPYLIKTWRDMAGMYIQLFLFCHSAGATITPFLVGLYLPDGGDNSTTKTESNLENYTNFEFSNTTQHMIVSLGKLATSPVIEDNQNSRLTNDTEPGIPVLVFPYFFPVIGLIIPVFLLVAVVLLERKQKASSVVKDTVGNKEEVDTPLQDSNDTKPQVKSQYSIYIMFSLAFLFGIGIGGIEATFAGWIIAFQSQYYDHSFSTIAWAATLFWFGQTIGRLIAIPGARYINAKKYQLCLLVSLNISNIAYMIMYNKQLLVSYICAFITGMSLSPMMGNLIMFLQNVISMPEWMASVLYMSTYTGSMAVPYLVGLLFATVSPLSFVVVLVVCSVSQLCIFVVMVFYGKSFIKPVELVITMTRFEPRK